MSAEVLPLFSHVYVEEDARDLATTQQLLNRFPKSQLVSIQNYKQIFSRSRQDWRAQKESPKLVIAKKRDDFLYPGSAVLPNFGHENFFYNTLVMNCLYDCDYCYLQGLYSSANMVVFANIEDYFVTTDAYLNKFGSLYLCISYDTDLLPLENLLGYCEMWHKFASARPGLTIELRTKSAGFGNIKHLSPISNFILAWTVSPQIIVEKYEKKTPSLKARLSSIRQALEANWRVRLCIDPILAVSEWRKLYSELAQQLLPLLSLSKTVDMSLGLFRMNHEQLSRIRAQRRDTDILYFPFERIPNLSDSDSPGNLCSYPEDLKGEMFKHLTKLFDSAISSDRIDKLSLGVKSL